MQRQSEQVQVRDTCVISTAQNYKKQQRQRQSKGEGQYEGEGEREAEAETVHLMDNWAGNWPSGACRTHKKCVPRWEINDSRCHSLYFSLPLSVSPSRSHTRLSATEAIIIALIVSCVLCFILSGPELHKGVSPEKCPPLELRVSTFSLSISTVPLCST